MLYHLMDLSKEWRIEIYYSEGAEYERNQKGFWDMIDKGAAGGGYHYLYSPTTGLKEED